MVRSFGIIEISRPALHDEVAALARDIAGVETGLISLVASERNWFAGVANFPEPDQCRWSSFCTHVVADPDQPLWIEDATLDFRFAGNPYVTGEQKLRFYAGIPILVNGYAVGSLCVISSEPRSHDPLVVERLCRLSKIVGEDLANRHQVQSLRHSLAASADALIVCNEQGIVTDWSEGAKRLFGFERADVLGQSLDLIIPPEEPDADNGRFSFWRFEEGAGACDRLERQARCKDGSCVEVELWLSNTYVNSVRHIHLNIRDISERKRHSNELVLAKAEAEAANSAKSTFLANMSHELRTPLNGVVAVTDLLRKTDLTHYQAELTGIIQLSSDQLRRLVGDILDLARIESGELNLAEVPMIIADVMDDVTNLSLLNAQSKGLTLRVDVGSECAVPVMGDALRLKQVLTNLVSNAVKFTDKGSVVVRVRRAGSHYKFEVIDTGIGVTEGQKSLIFERFQQADGTITRKFGGTGLGLAISQELVAAMGGHLDCLAQPQEGAHFWFTLPLKDAELLAAEKPPALRSECEMGRALVVDDNATNRRVAELLLGSIGAEVVSVEDGEQAVDAFMHQGFDVILMDMMMPVLDGIAATQAIRRIETAQNLHRTPIVMLTANSSPDHIAASLDAGADLHLAKPVNAAALFDALGSLSGVREEQPSSVVVALSA